MTRIVLFAFLALQQFVLGTADAGSLPTGEKVHIYTITNGSGASLSVSDLGARIVGITVPDKDGKMDDIVVGGDTPESFTAKQTSRNGATIGRYANRIDGAAFELDGVRYELDANQKLAGRPVCCHGGSQGFDSKIWKAVRVKGRDRAGIRFSIVSPDGDCGFPGKLTCTVTFWWTNDNVCRIEYAASTDKPTVVNFTNHVYFNLRGQSLGNTLDHILQIDASNYVQTNRQYCPDLVLPVADTPYDFRKPQRVDWRLSMPENEKPQQLKIMRGSMSCCFVLDGYDGSLRRIATLSEPVTGRSIEVRTTEPALQLFPGTGFNGSVRTKGGAAINKNDGIALETMHFADSPNQDRFPSTVLRPGEKFRSVTEYIFR